MASGPPGRSLSLSLSKFSSYNGQLSSTSTCPLNWPLGLLRHVGGICGGGNQAHRPLRDGRLPSVALPGRQADAVQRGGGGSNVHEGGTCGDLDEEITSGAGTGKQGHCRICGNNRAGAVDESDPRKLGR